MPPPKKSKPTPASVNPTPAPPSAPATSAIPAMAAAAVERSELKGSGKPKAPTPGTRTPSADEIAKRAYEIYASRGYASGDQNADWLEAERQLKAGL